MNMGLGTVNRVTFHLIAPYMHMRFSHAHEVLLYEREEIARAY